MVDNKIDQYEEAREYLGTGLHDYEVCNIDFGKKSIAFLVKLMATGDHRCIQEFNIPKGGKVVDVYAHDEQVDLSIEGPWEREVCKVGLVRKVAMVEHPEGDPNNRFEKLAEEFHDSFYGPFNVYKGQRRIAI